MEINNYKEICEFIISVYGGIKEPVPYEDDYKMFVDEYDIDIDEQSYCIGYIDGQNAGISRVLERMEQLMLYVERK
jgi:hypothetical protein